MFSSVQTEDKAIGSTQWEETGKGVHGVLETTEDIIW